MPLDPAAVVAEIDAVLDRCGVRPGETPPASDFKTQTDGWVASNTTSILALLDRLAGPQSPHREAVQKQVDQFGLSNTYALAHAIGVLGAFRADVEAGYTRTLAELVHADVFADFIGMADELLSSGYKDAAAVIGGSVLEEHLRALGDKHGVDIERPDGSPKKADTLNADLCKAGVYNKLEQKNVTAWLDLRNNAAHGRYSEYDEGHVVALLRDVRSFMTRYPA